MSLIIGESSRRRKIDISDGEGRSGLSHKILMKIALGLPVKSLLRFLCVSKQWGSTIRSKDFKHEYLIKSLNRQQTQGLLFTFSCEDKCFVFTSPHLENVGEASSSLVASYNMTYNMVMVVDAIAPSVHGLFCYGPTSGFVIYIPCTRRSVVLPGISSRCSKNVVNHYVCYATDSGYKVLCMMNGKHQFGRPHAFAEEIWVLTLGNELSWRMVNDFPSHNPTSYEMCIDGVLYYGARIGADLTEDAIMSFDVSSEKFHLIRTPANVGKFLSVSKLLRSSKLTSYEGKLAILHADHHPINMFDLWVLEDASNEEWSYKTFHLPSLVGWTTDPSLLQLCSATNAGEVILAPGFVRESPYGVVCYDPKKDSFRKIEMEGLTKREVPDEVKWWYSYPISVFPDPVENLKSL